MNNYKKHLKAALISGLGYGFGFVIGIVLIKLIFDSGLLDSVADLFSKPISFGSKMSLKKSAHFGMDVYPVFM